MRYIQIALIALIYYVLCPFVAHGVHAESNPIYAKKLVLKVMHDNPDMLDVIFHVTPTGETQNYAVAAYTATEEGGKSGEDDLGVANTGAPLIEIQKDGVRLGVLIQLREKDGKPIGALGLMYPFHKGQDPEQLFERSRQIRDQLAKQIPDLPSLFRK